MKIDLNPFLWNLRYVVILAVILSVLASITLFIIGSWDILYSIVFQNPLTNDSITHNNDLLFKIISSIDMFLNWHCVTHLWLWGI